MPTKNPTGDSVLREPTEKQRVVQFTVPESVFNHAKAQAYLSGMPWKTYLQSLLEQAGNRPSGETECPQ